MQQVRINRIALASIAAGPVFLTAPVLAHLYLQLPAAIPIPEAAEAMAFVVAVMLSAFFGVFLAFIPNLMGTVLMEKLSAAFPAAGAAPAWSLAGAVAAGLPAWLLDSDGIWICPFAVTGAVCALICRGTGDRD